MKKSKTIRLFFQKYHFKPAHFITKCVICQHFSEKYYIFHPFKLSKNLDNSCGRCYNIICCFSQYKTAMTKRLQIVVPQEKWRLVQATGFFCDCRFRVGRKRAQAVRLSPYSCVKGLVARPFKGQLFWLQFEWYRGYVLLVSGFFRGRFFYFCKKG